MAKEAREGLKGFVVPNNEVCAKDNENGRIHHRGIDIDKSTQYLT